MAGHLDQALAAIDAADPRRESGKPEAFLYGQRMSAECDRIFADAPDVLKIAARGQHIERWVLRRADYPEGRAGYLAWRRELADHHAARVGRIMTDAGCSASSTCRMHWLPRSGRDPGDQVKHQQQQAEQR